VSNTNAVLPFTGVNLKDLAETLGITQFLSETAWYQTIGGLLIQGGLVTGASDGDVIPFNAAFPSQPLFVAVQSINSNAPNSYITAATLTGFTVKHTGGGSHDYYWFAIGA
jgi:hypothetical protein